MYFYGHKLGHGRLSNAGTPHQNHHPTSTIFESLLYLLDLLGRDTVGAYWSVHVSLLFRGRYRVSSLLERLSPPPHDSRAGAPFRALFVVLLL